MGRIEDIKERLKTGAYQGRGTLGSATTGGVDRKASTDIRHLLSRLEIAETALAFYAETRNYYERNVLPCSDTEGTEHPIMDDEGDKAKQALKQIREE